MEHYQIPYDLDIVLYLTTENQQLGVIAIYIQVTRIWCIEGNKICLKMLYSACSGIIKKIMQEIGLRYDQSIS